MKSTTYTPEFRSEAVELVLAQGLTREEGAQRADAESALKEHIEIFYKRQRRHWRLGYESPARFAENCRKTAPAA